jgi:hypothetical protein
MQLLQYLLFTKFITESEFWRNRSLLIHFKNIVKAQCETIRGYNNPFKLLLLNLYFDFIKNNNFFVYIS